MISVKSFSPVIKFERPSKVPPPIIVPETRSNELKLLIFIIETPDPIETKSLGKSDFGVSTKFFSQQSAISVTFCFGSFSVFISGL